MRIVSFVNEPPQTAFAPVYQYVMGEGSVDVDFDKIAQIILLKEKEIISTLKPPTTDVKDAYTGLGTDSITSRWTEFNVFEWDEPEIQKLKSCIRTEYFKFLDALRVPRTSVYIQCWANVMRPGQQIKAHIHDVNSFCYLGGHVTIKCEDSSTVYINPINQINEPVEYFSKNEVGKCTFFQNNIPHYTTIHNGKDVRITIAFDLIVEPRYLIMLANGRGNHILPFDMVKER